MNRHDAKIQDPGAARLAESEWRQARREAGAPSPHPGTRQIHDGGDPQTLRGIEWERARPTDHQARKAQVGSRQPGKGDGRTA